MDAPDGVWSEAGEVRPQVLESERGEPVPEAAMVCKNSRSVAARLVWQGGRMFLCQRGRGDGCDSRLLVSKNVHAGGLGPGSCSRTPCTDTGTHTHTRCILLSLDTRQHHAHSCLGCIDCHGCLRRVQLLVFHILPRGHGRLCAASIHLLCFSRIDALESITPRTHNAQRTTPPTSRSSRRLSALLSQVRDASAVDLHRSSLTLLRRVWWDESWPGWSFDVTMRKS